MRAQKKYIDFLFLFPILFGLSTDGREGRERGEWGAERQESREHEKS